MAESPAGGAGGDSGTIGAGSGVPGAGAGGLGSGVPGADAGGLGSGVQGADAGGLGSGVPGAGAGGLGSGVPGAGADAGGPGVVNRHGARTSDGRRGGVGATQPRGGGGPGAERDADRVPNVLSPERYLAWLYSPASQQPAFAALCEIESEVAASLRPGIDHHVAHARLQWWRDEAQRSARGQPVHPLTRELLEAYGSASYPADGAGDSGPGGAAISGGSAARRGSATSGGAAAREGSAASGGSPGTAALPDISGFVDTAVWDLASATFETRKELAAYCERWAEAMFEPAASVAARGAAASARAAQIAQPAPAAPSATSRWRALGAAVREIELLAHLGPEAHAGRLRVPLDELERAGVDPKDIPKPPWAAPLAALLAERHVALRTTVANTVAEIEHEAQASYRGLLVWAALAWRMSLRAEGALPGMITPGRFHALTDGWQAWRAARRATTGTFRLG